METPTKLLRATASRDSVPGTILSSAFSRSVLTSGSAFSFTERAAVLERRDRLRTPAWHEEISGTFRRRESVQMKMPRCLGLRVRTRCVHPSPPLAVDAGAPFGNVDVVDVMMRRVGVRANPTIEGAAHDIKPRCGLE